MSQNCNRGQCVKIDVKLFLTYQFNSLFQMLKTDAQKVQDYYSALSVEEQRKYRPKITKILKL